jgi:hypothetical protein
VNESRVHLAPEIPSIESLGAQSFEDFFRAPGAPGFERAKLVRASDGFEEIRYPLPDRGVMDRSASTRSDRSTPTSSSTAFALLRRFTHASRRDRFRARFMTPRSMSLAEREWNLLCHLRAHGIGAPEPLAVGRGDGSMFAERSFVVLRELDDMLSLRDWARADLEPEVRNAIREALVLAFDRMWSAGVWLPRITADNVLVAAPHRPAGPDPDCVARAIVELRSDSRVPSALEHEHEHGSALKWGELPEVAFTEFRGGRILAHVAASHRRKIARSLEDELRALRFELELGAG